MNVRRHRAPAMEDAMLELLEQQKRLTTNQKKIVAAAVIGDMLYYFDFGLIGFALAFIIGPC
jgi:MFS transporter, putative metabolite:H+ symporter